MIFSPQDKNYFFKTLQVVLMDINTAFIIKAFSSPNSNNDILVVKNMYIAIRYNWLTSLIITLYE